MSSTQATVRAVSALFVAAGRNAGDVEFSLYHGCFDGVTDAELDDAVLLVVKTIDLALRAPSPALVLDTVRAIRRQNRERTPAIEEDTGPPLAASDLAARVRAVRGAIKTIDRAIAEPAHPLPVEEIA